MSPKRPILPWRILFALSAGFLAASPARSQSYTWSMFTDVADTGTPVLGVAAGLDASQGCFVWSDTGGLRLNWGPPTASGGFALQASSMAISSSAGFMKPQVCVSSGSIHVSAASLSGAIRYWRTSDNGATWQVRDVSGGPGTGFHGLTCDPSGNPTVVFDLGGEVHIKTSSDGGQSFNPPLNLSNSPAVSSVRPKVDSAMALAVTTVASTFREGNDVTVFTSRNGGASLIFPVTIPSPGVTPVASDGPSIVISRLDPDLIAVTQSFMSSTPGGTLHVATSTDGGAIFGPWQPVAQPATTTFLAKTLCTAVGNEILPVSKTNDAITVSNHYPGEVPPPATSIGTLPLLPPPDLTVASHAGRVVVGTNFGSQFVVATAHIGAQLQTIPGTGCFGAQGSASVQITGNTLATFAIQFSMLPANTPYLLGVSPRMASPPVNVHGCLVSIDANQAFILSGLADAWGNSALPIQGPLPGGLSVYGHVAYPDMSNPNGTFSLSDLFRLATFD